MTDEVYDIEKVNCKILPQTSNFPNSTIESEIVLDDFSDDGFGITPQAEKSLIEGLNGPAGFNIDPSDSAEATISLLSTSDAISKLRSVWQDDLVVRIQITTEIPDAVGFNTRTIKNAMITTPPEWTTDGNEAPAVEFEFIGYGFSES